MQKAMSYFVNLAKANADNNRLSAELTALAGERDKLTAALADRDAAAESCRAQFDATLADLTEKLSVSTKEIAALQAAAKTVGQQAAEVIAAQGIDPAKLPKDNAKSNAPAPMKRDAFEKLSPQERVTHLRAGGIVTD